MSAVLSCSLTPLLTDFEADQLLYAGPIIGKYIAEASASIRGTLVDLKARELVKHAVALCEGATTIQICQIVAALVHLTGRQASDVSLACSIATTFG